MSTGRSKKSCFSKPKHGARLGNRWVWLRNVHAGPAEPAEPSRSHPRVPELENNRFTIDFACILHWFRSHFGPFLLQIRQFSKWREPCTVFDVASRIFYGISKFLMLWKEETALVKISTMFIYEICRYVSTSSTFAKLPVFISLCLLGHDSGGEPQNVAQVQPCQGAHLCGC